MYLHFNSQLSATVALSSYLIYRILCSYTSRKGYKQLAPINLFWKLWKLFNRTGMLLNLPIRRNMDRRCCLHRIQPFFLCENLRKWIMSRKRQFLLAKKSLAGITKKKQLLEIKIGGYCFWCKALYLWGLNLALESPSTETLRGFQRSEQRAGWALRYPPSHHCQNALCYWTVRR